MRRRQFLQAASVASVAFAGCSVPGRTTELQSPERTDEGDEVYWTFHEGGDSLLNAGFEFGYPLDSGLVPLEFHTWHRKGTHLERFRVELRFGRQAGEVSPDVYLDTFDGNPDPRIDFHDDPDTGTTVLDVPDLGPVGVGSVGLNLLVRPHGWLPEEIGVGIREVVTGVGLLGRRYVAEVDDRIPFAGRGRRPDPGG